MALLKIILYPAPLLHRISQPVEEIDDELRQLLENMAETMYAAPGIGLAAPQVGVLKRAIVIDADQRISEEEMGSGVGLLKMINPEIVERSGEVEWEEGCLSVPGFLQQMKRNQRVVCHYLDPDGREQRIEAKNLLAVVIQHEIDHLNGKLIIDEVSPLKQEMYLKKLKKGKLP